MTKDIFTTTSFPLERFLGSPELKPLLYKEHIPFASEIPGYRWRGRSRRGGASALTLRDHPGIPQQCHFQDQFQRFWVRPLSKKNSRNGICTLWSKGHQLPTTS